MSVLITGFEARKGMTNASEVLLNSLIDEYPDAIDAYRDKLHFKIVGDNTHRIKDELTQLLKDIEPDFCLFIGQAPGRNNITLESVATNYRYIGPADMKGKEPPGDVIESEGSAFYMSTLPNMEAMVNRLKTAEIPAAISNDGGNSLCNQILYHGLHYAAANNSVPSCGFLHIPALPSQVINQWPQHPFMPLAMSRQAVVIIVEELRVLSRKL